MAACCRRPDCGARTSMSVDPRDTGQCLPAGVGRESRFTRQSDAAGKLLPDAAVDQPRRSGPGAAVAAVDRTTTPSAALDLDGGRDSCGDVCAVRIERTFPGPDPVDPAGG